MAERELTLMLIAWEPDLASVFPGCAGENWVVRMMTTAETYAVSLTLDQLLLLRQRLSDGPGTLAVDSELDALLYAAQTVLRTREVERG